MADEKPTLETTTAAFNEMLAWLEQEIAEIEAKLPPGTKLSDGDLRNLVLQGVGKYGPEFWTALIADGVQSIFRGHGPNVQDDSFLA